MSGPPLNQHKASKRSAKKREERLRREDRQLYNIERRNGRRPTRQQVLLIENLCKELGREVPEVGGRAAAAALIDQLRQNLQMRNHRAAA